ncbi:MAG TPA: glycosyltransferase family 2 protein [Terriglobales bacterium]|nr:glycosyltransferase family 2 protein [Terriglobales bacterium]
MNATSQPLVSIVTPVYNEEDCLAECIESVLKQTYQNWDYTIVDNCSTDRSLEVARHYAARDPRIRVHENTRFLEMLANHNVAVRQISPASKYCKVLLADDWMYPECLEKMTAVAEMNSSVGVVSAYERFGERVRLTGLPVSETVVRGREACRQFLLGALVLFGSQTSVLYRADLLRTRDPFYVETDKYADFEACFALLQNSDLGFVHQVLTFSRPRSNSMGAISADIGAHFKSILGLIFTYGGNCLSREEYEHCLASNISSYYSFLGRRLWVERDRFFWAYHRATLTEAGVGFSRLRLAKAAVVALSDAALSPQRTKERIKRLWSLAKVRSWDMRRMVIGSNVGSAEGPEPAEQARASKELL